MLESRSRAPSIPLDGERATRSLFGVGGRGAALAGTWRGVSGRISRRRSRAGIWHEHDGGFVLAETWVEAADFALDPQAAESSARQRWIGVRNAWLADHEDAVEAPDGGAARDRRVGARTVMLVIGVGWTPGATSVSSVWRFSLGPGPAPRTETRWTLPGQLAQVAAAVAKGEADAAAAMNFYEAQASAGHHGIEVATAGSQVTPVAAIGGPAHISGVQS